METTIKYIRESMISGCKILDIYGENYAGHTNHRRPASRAVMVEDGKILLSYEELLKRWMVPGGGLEGTETPADCCVREAAEETGRVVETGACFMQINEYFEDWAFISYFFECTIKGTTDRNPTNYEQEVGARPEWVSFEEALEIFSHYEDFAEVDEQRRGIYFREYTALQEYRRLLCRSV